MYLYENVIMKPLFCIINTLKISTFIIDFDCTLVWKKSAGEAFWGQLGKLTQYEYRLGIKLYSGITLSFVHMILVYGYIGHFLSFFFFHFLYFFRHA
jgi:hypothetical protein